MKERPKYLRLVGPEEAPETALSRAAKMRSSINLHGSDPKPQGLDPFESNVQFWSYYVKPFEAIYLARKEELIRNGRERIKDRILLDLLTQRIRSSKVPFELRFISGEAQEIVEEMRSKFSIIAGDKYFKTNNKDGKHLKLVK